MLSNSAISGVYFSVQKRANPPVFLLKIRVSYNSYENLNDRNLHPNLERAVAGYEDVKTQIKFLATNEQRLLNIA